MSKAIFMWYPQERVDLKTIHDENDVLTDHELVIARNFWKNSKHASLHKRYKFHGGFCVKWKMTEEEKKLITWEKHPGGVAQGRELAALVKKIKEDILSNKEQSTVQSTEQSTEQSSVQSTVQSDYVYCVGILAVLVIGVCVFFTYNTFQPKTKKLINEKQSQPLKRCHML